jgi:GAF domain-containing protein
MPLRLRGNIIGALNLFRSAPGPLAVSDIALAQAIADLATITILQEVATAKALQRDEQPQFTLGGRVIIEQAKGTLVEHRRMDMPTVFALIRGTPN